MIFCFFFSLAAFCCNSATGDVAISDEATRDTATGDTRPIPAAERTDLYLPLLAGKRIGLVVNQTSMVGETHLADTLRSMGQDVSIIFSPEHGFRGDADAGAQIKDGLDVRTGIPIRSLYGKNKKPSQEDLAKLDLIVFDIQDVGARFYTYISTLHYVMESAARYGVPVLVLDRPNPNGHYVDGPIRKPGFESFVGIDPIPVVHGLTVGEYARMVNGEGWLGDELEAELTVVPVANYTHSTPYVLPVAPSPNLPNQASIYLYPSLCFFEGTAVSIGRGTMRQFQLYGHPKLSYGDTTFTPRPGPGSADPKLKGQQCRGVYLGKNILPAASPPTDRLELEPLLSAYAALRGAGVDFFTRPDFFDLLAGTDRLRLDIEAGKHEEEIRMAWRQEVADYLEDRRPYLLYPE